MSIILHLQRCNCSFTSFCSMQSPISALGFAYYGGMIANLGDLRGGYRFTKLAKALIHKYPVRLIINLHHTYHLIIKNSFIFIYLFLKE